MPTDLSKFNPKALEFELLLDDSSTITDETLLKFTWKMVSYESENMSIQIIFVDPLSISAGSQRDKWKITVTDPDYFISEESGLKIPLNSDYELKLPKMMPNTEFTSQFVAMTEGFGAVAKTTLIGNWVTNLALQGAMHFLWGLIHCL